MQWLRKYAASINSLYRRHPVILISSVFALLLPPLITIFFDPGLSPIYYHEILVKYLTQWPRSSVLSCLTFILYPLGFPSDQTGILSIILGHYLLTLLSFISNYLLVLGPAYFYAKIREIN